MRKSFNPLKPKDKVAIVSTAKAIDRESIKNAIEIIESWGFEVELGKHVLAQDRLFAGSDQQRSEDLQWAIDSDEIKAIFCARGGYGTIRIIDQIDFSCLSKKKKLIFGFSDITVLHSHLQSNYDGVSVHASMPIDFAKNSVAALESIQNTLFHHPISYVFPSIQLNQIGTVHAEVIGGNLSILHNLLGTNSSPNYQGKILLLEDLCEYIYHLDRMLWALKKAGVFNQISGLIVGGFTDMKEGAIPFEESAYEVIKSFVKDLHIPIAFNAPFGHFEDNRAIVFGVKTRLEVSNTSVLISQ